MYLEFFGMPGVGKTTARDNLLGRFGYVKITKVKSILDMEPKYSFMAWFKMMSIYRFVRGKYYVSNKEWKRFKRSLFVCLYHYYKTRHKCGVYVTDHGIIQTLSQLSLLKIETDIEILGTVLKKLPYENVSYVYLKADSHKVMKRGKKRGKFERDVNELTEYMLMYDRVGMRLSGVDFIDATKSIKNIMTQLDKIIT